MTSKCNCGKFQRTGDGIYVDSKGYLSITAGPQRGMRLHELVARAKWGDLMVDAPDRVIHHRDGDKLNNDPNNLLLLREAEHNAVSAKQAWWFKTHDIKLKESWDGWFEQEKEMIEKFEPNPYNSYVGKFDWI